MSLSLAKCQTKSIKSEKTDMMLFCIYLLFDIMRCYFFSWNSRSSSAKYSSEQSLFT